MSKKLVFNIFRFFMCVIFLFLISCNKQNDAVTIVIYTTALTEITNSSAVLGGVITKEDGQSIIARGICWGKKENPTIKDSLTKESTLSSTFASKLTNLESNTRYYLRAYVTNASGTNYGNTRIFSTIKMPMVDTARVVSKTNTSLTINSNIIDNSGYDINSRGICWSTTSKPTIDLNTKITDGNGPGKFTTIITGLMPATTYYLRTFATCDAGTSYGTEIKITTLGGLVGGTVTDIDGNVYATIVLGNQTWMMENLRTTRYRNGDLIGTTTPVTKDISTQATPKYQWSINGIESNALKYGRLYTWYAATDNRNIAPVGWHLPSDAEFQTLGVYLTENGYASYTFYDTTVDFLGKSLSSTTLWEVDLIKGNIGCEMTTNNYSGFNAMPVGLRQVQGLFDYFNYSALLWGSTIYDVSHSWGRQLGADHSDYYKAYIDNKNGCSIRCLKDAPTSKIRSQIKLEKELSILHTGAIR